MDSGWEPCVKQNIPMFRFMQCFRAAEWETRGYLSLGIVPEALRGVQNIMTMKSRRKEFAMLVLQLRTGEYMTIGDDVVVQVSDISGNRCKLMIQAPKEIPVIRGELLERAGAGRPECVMEMPQRHQLGLSWNRNKSQVLIAMRRLLGQMDSRDNDVKNLRRQLDFLFPPEFASNETLYAPK